MENTRGSGGYPQGMQGRRRHGATAGMGGR